MNSLQAVTLTTDFGSEDSFVGQLKGAIYRVAPTTPIFDLCHGIPAHQIDAGAYALESGYGTFPPGTIHLAVVDPGVGGPRRAIAVECERYLFVAPDNGLLSRALDHETIVRVHEIANPAYQSLTEATTFEGRDRFAPAAAWLASGVPITELGPAVENFKRYRRKRIGAETGRTTVQVLWVDRFGNVVLDFKRVELGEPPGTIAVVTGSLRIERTATTFDPRTGAGPFLLVNSAGYVEIALARDRADRATGLAVGDRVQLEFG